MKARINIFFSIAIMALLCIYTYVSMHAGFDQNSSTASMNRIVFVVVIISGIALLFIRNNSIDSGFSRFWIVWIVWMFLFIVLLRVFDSGFFAIWRYVFSPMVFLFCYSARKACDKIETVFVIGFVVLFFLAFYLSITSLKYRGIVIGEEISVTNLVFWCLCAVPFFFLISRNGIQMFLLSMAIIIVLLTYKRSATICIGLIALFYVLYRTKTSKTSLWSYFVIVLGVLIVYYVITRYFQNSILGVAERMSKIQESEGSGRIPLYKDVINVLQTNDLFDWVFGRGVGSITITRHTNAHNDALQMLFEFGVIGLVLYFLMLWMVIKRTIALRKMKSNYYMGYFASFVIFIVLGAVSNLVVFNSYFSFICAYWGLAEYEITKKTITIPEHNGPKRIGQQL